MDTKKTIRAWFQSKNGEEHEILLPETDLKVALKSKGIDVDSAITNRISESVVGYDYTDLKSALDLNMVLQYVNRSLEPNKLWDAFVAIQEVLGTDIIDTYHELLEGKFELFVDFIDMADLARYLVKEGRVFNRRIPEEALEFFDYQAIADNLSWNSDFYETTVGILWRK